MRSSIIDFIKLEQNDSTRLKNKQLKLIVELIIDEFNKYQLINVEFNEGTTDNNSVNIIFKTSNNKYITFYIREDIDNFHISLFDIRKLNPKFDNIFVYDYCQCRKQEKIFEKLRNFANIKKQMCTTDYIKCQTLNYSNSLKDFFNLEEVDKILHTDYWPDDIIHDWRVG
jgi:hypothetical protein